MIYKPYVKKMIGDTETPVTIYKKYVGEEIGFLLESRDNVKGRYSFIAKNPFITMKNKIDEIEINGKKEKMKDGKVFLDYVRETIKEYEVINPEKIPFAGGAYGNIAYDAIRQYEYLPNINPDDIDIPESNLMFIKEGIIYDHFHQSIIFMALEIDDNEGKERAEEKIKLMEESLKNSSTMEIYSEEELVIRQEAKSNTTKEEYMEMVEKAKKYIYEGDIFQVVLSQRWELETNENPFKLYRKLRAINPSPYLYFFNFGEYQIAGSSPEMLVELKKDKVYTCPIAGTRKRGKNEEEDKFLAEDLLADPKERAEHVMLVDLGRNDMGRVSKLGTVKVTEFMEVYYYSHVIHLVSLVEGERLENKDAFDILATFLPAGTLSGAPKIRAMEIIDELEKNKRGVYGGAIGYFTFDGEMDTCIAIRTMLIKGNKVYMQAGAGITAESVPETEYEETCNKVRALLTAIKS